MRALLSRHRRLLAAAFAAAAAALALTATTPHPVGVRVWVAARDLPTGRVLSSADVILRPLPRAAVPSGVVPSPRGRALSSPLRRGEPVTDARLSTGGPLAQSDPMMVATPIRLADAAVARLLRPGYRVDVLSAREEGPLPARTVASSVVVLAVPKPDPDTDEGALIVIRTDRTQAAALARASVDSRLSITVVSQ
jgi:Flp pilus assembly protein CpaB